MLRYMKKYWWMGVVAAMFMVLEVSADLYQPGVMAVIVDDGILGGAGGSPDIALIEREGLKMILVVVLGGFCAASISLAMCARPVSARSCTFPFPRPTPFPPAR